MKRLLVIMTIFGSSSAYAQISYSQNGLFQENEAIVA
jgi:hypothetical protein